MKRKASHPHSNAEMAPSAIESRRMYTVLPPPADYNADSGISFTLPQPENIRSVEAPSEHNLQEFGEELDQDLEADEQKTRRKRRKKRLNLQGDLRKDGVAPTKDSSIGQKGMPADEEAVRVSRNKKRKLKKKRHKEKLLSMGLMPRATALEFTYQKQKEEEEKDDARRVADVADFLRNTMEIYESDSLMHAENLPRLSGVLQGLLSSITSGSRPTFLLEQLHTIHLFVQHKERDRLEKALQDLCNSTLMSAEESTVVATLFHYWITDILPMKRSNERGLSTTHP
ncbi:glutamate-rich protein 1 isoform X2 [Dunckerocampus dactyliophorus]|nr:glutamate-rich protein 1 isoform X2 [Dunckerocampus dactyliophorus]